MMLTQEFSLVPVIPVCKPYMVRCMSMMEDKGKELMGRITIQQNGVEYVAITREEFAEFEKYLELRRAIDAETMSSAANAGTSKTTPRIAQMARWLQRTHHLSAKEKMELDAQPSRLAYWRKKSGRTQKSIAIEAGITPSYFAQIEAGKKLPTLSVLNKIAYVMQIPPEDIFPNFETTATYIITSGHNVETGTFKGSGMEITPWKTKV